METQDNDLKTADYQINEFSLEGKNMWGKVVYVYDGDTVHIVFKMDNKLVKFNCRLAGLDTPEIAPKNSTDEKVKIQEAGSAVKSKKYLLSKVTNIPIEKETMTKNEVKAFCAKSTKLVWVKCFNFDKYGRLLVDLYDGPDSLVSFSKDMIEKKFAIGYDGGTKKQFNNENFN